MLAAAARAAEVVGQAAHPRPIHVARDHHPRLAAERDRLPAGRGGRVVQGDPLRQVGVPGEQRLRRVLHHEGALGESGQVFRPPAIGHESGAEGRRLDGDPGCLPAPLQLAQPGACRLEHEAGPTVVPLQEPAGLVRAEAPEPALHQPRRVRMPLGQLRRGLGRPRVFRRLERRLCSEAPQHRVHEPAGAWPAALPRERHAGVHRGVGRHAVERDELVGAEPEEILEPGWHFAQSRVTNGASRASSALWRRSTPAAISCASRRSVSSRLPSAPSSAASSGRPARTWARSSARPAAEPALCSRPSSPACVTRACPAPGSTARRSPAAACARRGTPPGRRPPRTASPAPSRPDPAPRRARCS